MKPITYNITFITPLFSAGYDQKYPEIRPASIRGQLHFWFRMLGYTYALEKSIFGSIASDSAHASRLVIRVTFDELNSSATDYPTLPHKTGGHAAFKSAFDPGTQFQLQILSRRRAFSADETKAIQHTINAWLLCGALGLRSGRGGGSMYTDELSPETPNHWKTCINELPTKKRFGSTILDQSFQNAEAARKVITDTIGGQDKGNHPINLDQINQPLGAIKPSRKTSPLRMTVRQLNNDFRIIATWDQRNEVTSNTSSHLSQAIEGLIMKEKPLGSLLKKALPDLIKSSISA